MEEEEESIPEKVKKDARKRMGSTFYLSWIIAFAACNWKAILVILFPTENWHILERLKWIGDEVYAKDNSALWLIYVYPFGVAILAAMLLPIFVGGTDIVRYFIEIFVSNIKEKLDENYRPYKRKAELLDERIRQWENDYAKLKNEKEQQESRANLFTTKYYGGLRNYIDNTDSRVKDLITSQGNKDIDPDKAFDFNTMHSLGLIAKNANGRWKLTDEAKWLAEQYAKE